MAQPLAYTPPPQPPGQNAFTAHDDLERLLQTLHETGTLRILHDLLARFEDVVAVPLSHLDTPAGRDGLSTLLVLGRFLGQLDADGVGRFFDALAHGFDDAGERLRSDDDPPGFIALTKRLHDADVRRGLDAVVTLLGSLGARLGRDYQKGESPVND